MPLEVTIVKKRSFKNPGFKTTTKLMTDIGKLVIRRSIIDNVVGQTTATGGGLKPNPSGYRAWKVSKGYGSRSLVAKERSFTDKSSWVVKADRKSVTVRPRAGIFATKVESVQKKFYEGWFAVSRIGLKTLRALLEKFARERLKKAQAKG